MTLTKSLLFAAVLSATAAGVAFAAPSRLTDVEFLQANRCLGLMSSKSLGEADVAAVKALVGDQSRGRIGYILDRGDQMREDAARQAGRAGPDLRAHLIAERDGVCRTLGQSTTASGGSSGHNSSIR
ncbi:MAG: hypothetical protein ACHP84_10105 [Caulobacterales bacterium]